MNFNQHFIKSVLVSLCPLFFSNLAFSNIDSTDFEYVASVLKAELSQVMDNYHYEVTSLEQELTIVNQELFTLSEVEYGAPASFKILLKKIKLQEELTAKSNALQFKLNKARYRKGLDLIKIMYEKILGLDHHFHSLQTYKNIMDLSNPNSYPEFQRSRKELQQKLKRKNYVQLPSLLQTNPFMSATFTLVGSMLSGGEITKKEEDLNEIACILDFTVRMNADLNLIFYETEFLKESNANLREECTRLFKDYCKIIDYDKSLDETRKDDNWESVYDNLNVYIENLESHASESLEDPSAQKALTKGIANLEFSIHRLLDFLNQYSAFITQGEQYYQKFDVIVSNYQNEEKCASQLPHQFEVLKKDISISIDKFDEAYNVAELKGSKLKDLLFGEED